MQVVLGQTSVSLCASLHISWHMGAHFTAFPINSACELPKVNFFELYLFFDTHRHPFHYFMMMHKTSILIYLRGKLILACNVFTIITNPFIMIFSAQKNYDVTHMLSGNRHVGELNEGSPQCNQCTV